MLMPPTEPTSPSRFAFMNPANTNSAKLTLGDSGSKHRLIVVGGGAVVLLILFILFYALVLGHKPSMKNLVTLAQQQTELIYISSVAEQQASQQTSKNLAVNTSLTLTSGQVQLLTYLKKHGQKLTAKLLAQGESSAITQQLNAALAASNFDAVYLQTVQSQLTQYSQTINSILKTSSNKTETQLLKYEAFVAAALQNQISGSSKTLAGP